MEVLKQNGNKRVKIIDDKYGTDFHTMRNGFSWSGFPVDIELLKIMKDTITEYLTKKGGT